MTSASISINRFSELVSEVDVLPPRDELVDAIKGYDFVVQYTYDGIEVVEAKNYSELPGGLLELRAFNSSGELHAVACDGEIKGRVRTDSEGNGTPVFDEEHLVWGTAAADVAQSEEVVLREDRGTIVRLPKSALARIEPGSCATVIVRNYLDEGAIDPESGDTRFAFSDYRFVGFDVKDGE